MFITRNPAATLELCYVAQKLKPFGIDAAKVDYKPSSGARWSITWDKEKEKILAVPPQRHDTKQTKPGRISTTGRIANWVVQGRIVAAAENQSQPKADFLRFLYDPECPAVVRGRVSKWAQKRLCMVFTEKQQTRRDAIMRSDISDALLLQFSQMIRGGGERYTETDLCRYLGYADLASSHWARDWRRPLGAFVLQLQDYETVAMRPVVSVLAAIFDDSNAQKATRYDDTDRRAKPAPAASQQAPKHPTTLTLRRGVALW